MTTAQKTLIAFAKGQKAMAFLAYKADSTAINSNISFADFCLFMDKMMLNHLNSRAINPVTKKLEKAIWE